MTPATWYNAERVTQPGSVILNSWMAERGKVKAATINTADTYEMLTGGLGSAAGVNVSESSAMAVSAVYACVGIIGGAIAGMPFHLFKRTSAGRDRYDSDLWWMLNESPWPNWTAASAWKFAAQSIGLRGDGFWQIHRASPYSNTIVGFEPLLPGLVDKARDRADSPYLVTDRETGQVRVVDPADMLHFPGLGFDGFKSLTPIRAALRTSAGIAIAADQYASSFFANGARADFAITSTGKMTKEQADVLRATWASRHTGSANAHLPAVLAGGLDIKQLTMSAEDAQLLSTRKFQVEDVARIFGVPPHMIGHTEKSSSWGTGVEQMSIGFVRYTVGRYLDDMAQELNRKLWPRSRQLFGEFNRDALLEGDSVAQATLFSKALGGPGTQGWMTVNEVRKLKNLPPIKGGEELVKAGGKPAPDSAGAADTEPKDPKDPDESTD